MEKYIDFRLKEVIEIVTYHENILGINKELGSSEYLTIKNEIFELVHIFSVLDSNFKNEKIKVLLDDVLTLILYFDYLKFTPEKLQLMYDKKPTALTCEFSDFKNSFARRYKDFKLKAISLINTKIYYLDLLIWDSALKSDAIDLYLRQYNAIGVKSSMEYVKKANKKIESLISFRYKAPSQDKMPKYDAQILQDIKDFPFREVEAENPYMGRLLAAKDGIKFFQGMYDSDIKKIVKNIVFIKYKMHETILEEGDDSNEIFYLLGGKARVIAGTNVVGLIEQGNIFGEFSSITKERRTATIKANVDGVTVLRFNFAFESFEEAPYSFTRLYKNIIDSLIIKINSSNNQKVKAEETMLDQINLKIQAAQKKSQEAQNELIRKQQELYRS